MWRRELAVDTRKELQGKKKGGRKRLSGIRVLRRVIQILGFFIFPGFFIEVFHGIRTIADAIYKGNWTPQAGRAAVIVAGVLLITAVMGRFFCGFLCSFGAMTDLSYWIGRKLHIKKFRPSEQADRILKYLKYVVLAGIVILVWILGLPLLDGDNSPWTVFGRVTYLSSPSFGALLSAGGILLLGILILSLFIERAFCRYLCPLGGIFTLVSSFRLLRIHRNTDGCGKCRACTQACSMGIPLYRSQEIKSGECIDCFYCRDICPRRAVSFRPDPVIAAVAGTALTAACFFGGNLVQQTSSAQSDSSNTANQAETTALASSSGTNGESTAQTQAQTEEPGIYEDGVYTGTGQGFSGAVSVTVTVEGGMITDITVDSHVDEDQFFNQVQTVIPDEIIAAQSTDVDTVTGATFSSNGLLNAVADALQGHLRAGAESETAASAGSTAASAGSVSASEESTGASTANGSASAESSAASAGSSDTSSDSTSASAGTSSSASSIASLKDGTYTGSGQGWGGTVSVTVTVKSGKITDITVDSNQDAQEYFDRAEPTMIQEILDAQSIDVDTVSGATYSSNGILDAVADALGIDFTNPTEGGGQEGHGQMGGFGRGGH